MKQNPCWWFPCLLGFPYQPLVTARLNLLIFWIVMSHKDFPVLGASQASESLPSWLPKRTQRKDSASDCNFVWRLFSLRPAQMKRLAWVQKFPLQIHSWSSSLRVDWDPRSEVKQCGSDYAEVRRNGKRNVITVQTFYFRIILFMCVAMLVSLLSQTW